jgi:hypothetical protein
MSARGIQDLRDARRNNPNTFRIIVKKMKSVAFFYWSSCTRQNINDVSDHRELSNGHFSDDNQKRLNGPNIEVPIYEAKMTRDQRLVVSCSTR